MVYFRRLRTAGLFLLLLAGPGCSQNTSPATEGGIAWQPYESRVLDRARQLGQPVLLDFWAEWCIPCHELEAQTLSDPSVIEFTRSFVTVRADLTDYESPRSQRLRQLFEVTGVPEILFIDPHGYEDRSLRVVGVVEPEEFLRRLKEAS